MISMLFFTGRCISESSLQLKLLLQILYHHFLNHPPFLAYTCNIFLASINFLPPPPIPFSNEPDTTFLHEATIFCNVEHLYIDLAPLCQMNMYCTWHVMMFYQRNIANVWFYSHQIVHTNGTLVLMQTHLNLILIISPACLHVVHYYYYGTHNLLVHWLTLEGKNLARICMSWWVKGGKLTVQPPSMNDCN